MKQYISMWVLPGKEASASHALCVLSHSLQNRRVAKILMINHWNKFRIIALIVAGIRKWQQRMDVHTMPNHLMMNNDAKQRICVNKKYYDCWYDCHSIQFGNIPNSCTSDWAQHDKAALHCIRRLHTKIINESERTIAIAGETHTYIINVHVGTEKIASKFDSSIQSLKLLGKTFPIQLHEREFRRLCWIGVPAFAIDSLKNRCALVIWLGHSKLERTYNHKHFSFANKWT